MPPKKYDITDKRHSNERKKNCEKLIHRSASSAMCVACKYRYGTLRNADHIVLCSICRYTKPYSLMTATKAKNKFHFTNSMLINAYQTGRIKTIFLPNNRNPDLLIKLYYIEELECLYDYLTQNGVQLDPIDE